MKKKLLFTLTILAMSLCALASGIVSAKQNKKTVLKLSKSEICLYIGQVRKLDYSLSGNKKLKERVQWKSSDKKVATVNKKGEIKGKKTGKAKITAWIKGDDSNKSICKVKVKEFKEMNFSVPFSDSKYFENPIGLNIEKNNFDVHLINSKKELKKFINNYDMDYELRKQLYMFDDVDYEKNSILVYTTKFCEVYVHEVWNGIVPHKTDYHLTRKNNCIVLNANIVEEKIDYQQKPGADMSIEHIVFDIVPKKLVECVDKFVYNNI